MCYVAIMSNDIIQIDPHVLGGTPCIRGTRLSVYIVAGRFKSGETAKEIFDGYPAELGLGPEAVAAAVSYAEKHPFKEHPDARPWRKAASKDVA